MICRGTPQDILHNSDCETSLLVHRHLMFCAMYNKHTAAVSTGHKADRATSLRLSVFHSPVQQEYWRQDTPLRRATLERIVYASA